MQATILCYHKVGPGEKEGRRLNIEPSRLRSHIQYFHRKKRPFVRAADLALPWQTDSVCFSFDDAYESTMTYAPALFDEIGAKASFYAVSGLVGKTSEWDGDLARPLADWDLLRAAHDSGHEIGNHTHQHSRLASLPSDEQFQEIVTAHNVLRERGLSPGSFCYPYGSCNMTAIHQLRRAGYKVGLALGKRHATSEDDLLRLPRIVVAYSDALPMLLYKLFVKPKVAKSREPQMQPA